MILSNCKFLVTQNKKREVLEDADIVIQGNKIVEIGKKLGKKYPKERVLDCSSRIVMPGLINCHTHLGMTSLRGYSDDKELSAWLKEVIAAEKRLSKKDVAHNLALGIREALRTGTTTICDMYDPLLVDLAIPKKIPIRFFYFANIPSFDRNVKETDLLALAPARNDLPQTIMQGIGPHSIYALEEGTLRAIREYATVHNLLIHIHVAETRKERVECKQKTGFLPIEYLEHLGFLGPDVIIAHAVWLTKGELDILARRKVRVVHCPQSNMKLAGGGVMPLREMQERGITVCLGTDSVASNNSLDLFREMHTCALLHKHHYWDAIAADAQAVLDMATVNAALALNLNIGSIEEGKPADIITLDINDPNLQPIDKGRVVSHLVYAASGLNVSEVIVDGTMLVRGKKLMRKI